MKDPRSPKEDEVIAKELEQDGGDHTHEHKPDQPLERSPEGVPDRLRQYGAAAVDRSGQHNDDERVASWKTEWWCSMTMTMTHNHGLRG